MEYENTYLEMLRNSQKVLGLNPCSNGIRKYGTLAGVASDYAIVLILVLMEYENTEDLLHQI